MGRVDPDFTTVCGARLHERLGRMLADIDRLCDPTTHEPRAQDRVSWFFTNPEGGDPIEFTIWDEAYFHLPRVRVWRPLPAGPGSLARDAAVRPTMLDPRTRRGAEAAATRPCPRSGPPARGGPASGRPASTETGAIRTCSSFCGNWIGIHT